MNTTTSSEIVALESACGAQVWCGARRERRAPTRGYVSLRRKPGVGVALTALLLFAGLAPGQFAVDWSTVDGGGGTSTGGVYAVSGAIGQPDAGAMGGGKYSLTGGFWSLLSVVQTEGAPLLSIARTMTNTIAVSWPAASAGWSLQQNTQGVGSVNWSNVTSTIESNDTTRSLIIAAPTGSRFYRLVKP